MPRVPKDYEMLKITARLAVLFVLLIVTRAWAQIIEPPNRWHPYRGGTNCVQVVDPNGFFNCSPLVTINPSTGAFNSVLGGPIGQATALEIAPLNNTLQALANDLVIAKSTLTAVAPAGPGSGAVTFRVRPSPRIPGYCMVVAIAGGSFGVEYPVAFLNPNYPFSGPSNPANLFDYFTLDLPGGPGGC